MAKAKTTPIKTTVDAPTVNAVVEDFNSNGHKPDYQLIPIGLLSPSPTNPRKRFPEASIAELAGSIAEKGILEPLIVRPGGGDENGGPGFYEIVCGERRYRALGHIQANSGNGTPWALIVEDRCSVPCLVRELTDGEVLDIQIHENLHREDVHPMDEAYGYKFLQEKLGCDVAELALRVGKTESYVANRLKLNQLIPEVQKDVEDGWLTLGMALEIAKHAPESQTEIYNEIYDDVEWDHDLNKNVVTKDTDKTFKNLGTPAAVAQWASNNILHLLAKAPFDTKATDLRADGLACVNCPDRTGANASLFEGQISKKDSCLDTACWNAKRIAHLTKIRERIAHETSLELDQVPLVTTTYGSREPGVLGRNDFVQITPKAEFWETSRSKEKCDKSVSAVCVTNDEYGKVLTVCLPSSGCNTHFGKGSGSYVRSASAGSDSSKKSDAKAARIQRMERKEEIFDMRVSDIVRKRVFRMAAEAFVEEAPSSAAFEEYLPDLVTKLWLTSNNGSDSHTLNLVVQPIMRDITDEPKGFGWGTWPSHGKEYSQSDAGKAIANLSFRNRMLLLFLFTHGNKGNTYSDRMSSQREVRELAEYYDIDYRLLDAEVRVQVAGEKAKKQIDVFKAYLAAVEAGDEKAKIPRVWAESYKGQ